MKDEPKSLGIAHVREARVAMLGEEHILPFTNFVKQVRQEQGLADEVPYFDPFDGGTRAKALFILEAPGAKAVKSGFVSRNNPDETAKNMFGFLRDVGFTRQETALWNVVPWYIGSGTKIRPANSDDIHEGLKYLVRLIDLFPYLECLVLVGKKAAKVRGQMTKLVAVPVLETYHPSPLFVNRKPGNRKLIIKGFRQARGHLSSVFRRPEVG